MDEEQPGSADLPSAGEPPGPGGVETSRGRLALADAGFAVVAIAGVAAVWAVLFLDLFPLAEFRAWSAIELTPRRAWSHLENLVFRGRLFSRDASILYSAAAGEIAGTSIRGLNVLVLLPILGSAGALFVLARLVAVPRFAALVAVWLWAFSLPVSDAAGWQATINDRLALLFSLACLVTALLALRSQGRAVSLLLGNALAGPFLILAYGSKESAFYLAPVLVLLVLLERERSRQVGEARALRWAVLAVPLAYAIFHNARYVQQLRTAQSRAWAEHSLGGEPLANLGTALRHLFGYGRTDSPFPAIVLSVVVVGLTCLAAARARQRPREWRSLAWISSAFLGSVVLTLGAKGQPPFYQYSSRALLSLLVVRLAVSIAGSRKSAARWRDTTLAVVLIGNVAWTWAHSMPFYTDLIERSRSFVGSFPEVRECVTPRRGDAIELVTPLQFWMVHRFYSGTEDDFFRFLFPGWEVIEPFGGPPVRAEAGVDLRGWEPGDPETLYLVSDENFAITDLYFGGRRLACSPRPSSTALAPSTSGTTGVRRSRDGFSAERRGDVARSLDSGQR